MNIPGFEGCSAVEEQFYCLQLSADYGPVEGGLSGVGLGLEGDAALQEEIDYGVAAIFAGPQEGAFHLNVGGSRAEGSGLIEITLNYVEAAEACGAFQV